MAILKGFPPSNTIGCVLRLPDIEEKEVDIKDVPVEARFRNHDCEFLMLPKKHNGIRAVCYKGDKDTTPGNIYGFNEDIKVVWYRECFK